MHEGRLEVLDEGVGGSLTTHLQEVLPAKRGEQILTSKKTPGTLAPSPESIAARHWTMVLHFPPLTILTMSEITERFELEHQ